VGPMWEKKRLLSEAKSRVPAVSPHWPHRPAHPQSGLQTGAHGSAAGSGASSDQAWNGEANGLEAFQQAQRELDGAQCERNDVRSLVMSPTCATWSPPWLGSAGTQPCLMWPAHAGRYVNQHLANTGTPSGAVQKFPLQRDGPNAAKNFDATPSPPPEYVPR
jgi:hypothetical protein